MPELPSTMTLKLLLLAMSIHLSPMPVTYVTHIITHVHADAVEGSLHLWTRDSTESVYVATLDTFV